MYVRDHLVASYKLLAFVLASFVEKLISHIITIYVARLLYSNWPTLKGNRPFKITEHMIELNGHI